MGLYELVEDVGSGEVDGDAGEKIYGRRHKLLTTFLFDCWVLTVNFICYTLVFYFVFIAFINV